MLVRWRPFHRSLLFSAVFLGALQAEATEKEGGTTTTQPPTEFGRNWLQAESRELRDVALRVRLSDKQWIMEVNSTTAGRDRCRRITRALVYDARNGLVLLGRRELQEPITSDWSILVPEMGKIVNTPLDMVVLQNRPAVAGWPRYPLENYQWLQEPTYNPANGIARWSFKASTAKVEWAVFSWMLFDDRGYTTVLLLSRPADPQNIWSRLRDMRRPPIEIDDLVDRSPPPEVTPEEAAYDAGFL